MSRRGAGLTLIVLSGALYAARYLTAAIYGSNAQTWNAELFDSLLDYVGSALLWWSALALAAGIAYLVWAEVDEMASRRRQAGERPHR